MKVTCQIRRYEPDNDSKLKKIHGPQMARKMRSRLGAEKARQLGWGEDGFWAQSDLPLGEDPVQALEELLKMVRSWPRERAMGLGALEVRIHRGDD